MEVFDLVLKVIDGILKKTETLIGFGCVFLSLTNTLVAMDQYHELEKPLIELINLLTPGINNVISKWVEICKIAIKDNKETIKSMESEIYLIIRILSSWAETNQEIFEHSVKKNPLVASYYLNSENLISGLLTASQVTMITGIQETTTLISNTNVGRLDNEIDSMKDCCLEFINVIVSHLYQQELQPQIISNPIRNYWDRKSVV